MMRTGAHLSAAGGPHRAAAAAAAVGCRSLQLFLRPPGRWAGRPPADEDVARFRTAAADAGLVGACFAHAPYLLNLASADGALRRRSLDVLVEELRRAGRLGLAGVVLHPGSAGTGGRGEAESRCRDALAEALDRAGPEAARLVLEGTAGAGGQLGRGPAELARLLDPPLRPEVGVCLDTAHLWGAGYDLTGPGWRAVLAELGEHWGRSAPELVHGNDTAVELGSHRDRHAPPGDGVLGERFFRGILTDPALAGVPLVMEIPPGKNDSNVADMLARLDAWSR